MLCAGTTLLLNFKHSILSDIVKDLKLRSKSAGSIFSIKNVTSETLHDETVVEGAQAQENVKSISVHINKHNKPANEDQFGYYLAGLIDGDGHFSSQQQLIIVFSEPDAFLAYYIKEKIGYGQVKKVKNKNAYLFIISKTEGIVKVINLINGKLRLKYDQVIKNIFSSPKFESLNKFESNIANDLNNHWIAGFSDADGSFQIKILQRHGRSKPEIQLNFQVDQKDKELLILIKDYFGGFLGYRKSQDTYYYGSTNFGSAKKVINYFDRYPLLSSKHISYLKWRKAYLIIQKKDHLTLEGINKITKLKNTMNKGLNSYYAV